MKKMMCKLLYLWSAMVSIILCDAEHWQRKPITCGLESNPIVKIRWKNTTTFVGDGYFHLLSSQEEEEEEEEEETSLKGQQEIGDENHNDRRSLRNSSPSIDIIQEEEQETREHENQRARILFDNNNNKNAKNDSENLTFQVRQCHCAKLHDSTTIRPQYFCPLHLNGCEITAPDKYRCFKTSSFGFFGNMLPFILLIITFFFLALLCTNFGNQAIRYAERLLCPCRKERHDALLERQLEHLLRLSPIRTMSLFRAYRERQRCWNFFFCQLCCFWRSTSQQQQQYQQEEQDILDAISLTWRSRRRRPRWTTNDNETLEQQNQHPHSLVLKTRSYKIRQQEQQEDDDENDDDDKVCLICLSPLEEGQKVGDLECGHDFHSTCLKHWLKRRNHCPLCQHGHVGMPQYRLSSSSLPTMQQGEQTENNNNGEGLETASSTSSSELSA